MQAITPPDHSLSICDFFICKDLVNSFVVQWSHQEDARNPPKDTKKIRRSSVSSTTIHKKYTAPNGTLLNHTNLDLPALELGVTFFVKHCGDGLSTYQLYNLVKQFLQNIVEVVFNLPALELGVEIFAKHCGDGLRPTSSRSWCVTIFNLPALPLAACATPTASTTVTLRVTLQHICRPWLFLSREGLLLPGKLAVSKLFQIISSGSPHHATYHHDINLWHKIKNPQKSFWDKR